ncbi:bifunctional diguanylate cyclase/phosphodiesterase [Rhodococcus sp. X156]|uniref:putative bifunctional diguanylate cyclase/phosphodiesterase n=1 Tax=Rhodococcus sp. X156 TaxID=2499145 RepID=UPI000FD6D90A|nr:bifunctional diguanylate cyclase/phosphodiesterase [Rhodococcus sp. X156]
MHLTLAPSGPGDVKRDLEVLVTDLAGQLLAVTSMTAPQACTAVLRELVEHFDVDACYLRRNDTVLDASVLVAEWPPRAARAGPDPMQVVPFRDGATVLGIRAHPREVVFAPVRAETYRVLGQAVSSNGHTTVAVPLRTGSATVGVLGVVVRGERSWSPREIHALQAVAAFLTHLHARVSAEERLRFLADHDELTGLPAQHVLLTELRRRLAAPEQHPVGLVHVAVDRLKVVNHSLGHAAGDEFLRVVARRLTEAFAGDLVVRLGGDEFVLLLGEPARLGEAEQAAVRAQRSIAAPVALKMENVGRTASIGVAVAVPGRCGATELLNRVAQASTTSKERGGNTITCYTEQMHTEDAVRTDIEMRLRTAVQGHGLLLHYQPEIDLRTREVVGVEALVRWQHPVRGLLQPDSFIGIAESTNLAGELGRWVLQEACRQLAAWRRARPGLALQLRVNVSPVQLITADFVETVAAVLDEHDLAGPLLCLEITEHAVIHDLATVLQTLRGLKRLGVQVAIDDFGTGRSSLDQLKQLPVDTLKIDRGFVHNVDADPNDLAIVKSIIGLAQAFGLDVVAEGVENEPAAEVLRALGCPTAQGYLFSRPVPPEELERLLDTTFAAGLGAAGREAC